MLGLIKELSSRDEGNLISASMLNRLVCISRLLATARDSQLLVLLQFKVTVSKVFFSINKVEPGPEIRSIKKANSPRKYITFLWNFKDLIIF